MKKWFKGHFRVCAISEILNFDRWKPNPKPTNFVKTSIDTVTDFQLVEAVRWEYWNNKTRNVKEVLSNVEFLGRVESAAKWNSGIVLIAARLAKRVKRLFVYRYSQSAGVDLEGQQYNFTGT